MKRGIRRQDGGFWLLEAILAVTIFSIGIISLAGAVQNCMVAQRIKQDDLRARLALNNRMVEIEAGSEALADSKVVDLKGAFEGMKLKQTRVPVKRKNEKGVDITGISAVTLVVSWKADGQELSRELNFYVNTFTK
jgi:Tfp pilus assembly protein PilV